MIQRRPRDSRLARAAEAMRFLDGKMSESENAEYESDLESNKEKYEAVVDALALAAVARVPRPEDHEPDPEACAHARSQLERYVDDTLSRWQRRDVDEHLEWCEECQTRLAAEQREAQNRATAREMRRNRIRVLQVACAALLVVGGASAGWHARPVPALSGSQEEPPTGKNAVLSAEQRKDLVGLTVTGKNPRQLGAVADVIVRTVGLEAVSRADLHVQAVEDLKFCLRAVGRAGVAGSAPTGAEAWVRRLLLHPHGQVRKTASVWYPRVNPKWEADDELRNLVEAGRKAGRDSTGSEEPKRQ